MKLKSATLIAIFGALFYLGLWALGTFTKVATDNYETVRYFYVVPEICYLVFFVTLYNRQSDKET